MFDNNVRLTASVIIQEGDYFWYVENRKDKMWGFPSGKVKRDEIREEAAIREALQELGVHVALDYTVGIYEFISQRNHRTLNFVYKAHIMRGTPHIVKHGEISDIEQFSYHEVFDLCREGYLRAGKVNVWCLEDYLREQKSPPNAITNFIIRK
jgi:8-oxo-dGTP pyrophosphatase MutT (NUDIX family)